MIGSGNKYGGPTRYTRERDALITLVNEKVNGLDWRGVRQFISVFVTIIKEQLEWEGSYYWKGVGTFKVVQKEPYLQWHHRSGRKRVLVPKPEIRFRPSSHLLRAVNGSLYDDGWQEIDLDALLFVCDED
jgi:nucleoid DNA-binding protein